MNIYKISDENGKTVKIISTKYHYEHLGEICKDENDLNVCSYEKNGELVDNNHVEICGKKYKTVTIGNQTWLDENLDVETDSGSVKCYKESDGRLYQWDKAVEIVKSIPGWHLPTREEWNELFKTVGEDVNKLKSKSFGGTDDYGFGIFPSGLYSSGSYFNVGSYAYFWTSEETSSSTAYYKGFDTGSSMGESSYYKTFYYSVRLVKNSK